MHRRVTTELSEPDIPSTHTVKKHEGRNERKRGENHGNERKGGENRGKVRKEGEIGMGEKEREEKIGDEVNKKERKK
jgi:hypothetical protein